MDFIVSTGGQPLVVADPSCATAQAFMDLGASVVREVAKLRASARATLRWDTKKH